MEYYREQAWEPFELTESLYQEILNKNKNLTEAVVFLGGEWDGNDFD